MSSVGDSIRFGAMKEGTESRSESAPSQYTSVEWKRSRIVIDVEMGSNCHAYPNKNANGYYPRVALEESDIASKYASNRHGVISEWRSSQKEQPHSDDSDHNRLSLGRQRRTKGPETMPTVWFLSLSQIIVSLAYGAEDDMQNKGEMGPTKGPVMECDVTSSDGIMWRRIIVAAVSIIVARAYMGGKKRSLSVEIDDPYTCASSQVNTKQADPVIADRVNLASENVVHQISPSSVSHRRDILESDFQPSETNSSIYGDLNVEKNCIPINTTQMELQFHSNRESYQPFVHVHEGDHVKLQKEAVNFKMCTESNKDRNCFAEKVGHRTKRGSDYCGVQCSPSKRARGNEQESLYETGDIHNRAPPQGSSNEMQFGPPMTDHTDLSSDMDGNNDKQPSAFLSINDIDSDDREVQEVTMARHGPNSAVPQSSHRYEAYQRGEYAQNESQWSTQSVPRPDNPMAKLFLFIGEEHKYVSPSKRDEYYVVTDRPMSPASDISLDSCWENCADTPRNLVPPAHIRCDHDPHRCGGHMQEFPPPVIEVFIKDPKMEDTLNSINLPRQCVMSNVAQTFTGEHWSNSMHYRPDHGAIQRTVSSDDKRHPCFDH